MNYIGRRVYFDRLTGEVLQVTGQRYGEGVTQRTVEQDFQVFTSLSDRNPDTVGFIDLDYDAYAEDFQAQGRITSVDLETLRPMFTYPSEDSPEQPQEPQRPLTEQVAQLQAADLDNKEAIASLFEMVLMGGGI